MLGVDTIDRRGQLALLETATGRLIRRLIVLVAGQCGEVWRRHIGHCRQLIQRHARHGGRYVQRRQSRVDRAGQKLRRRRQIGLGQVAEGRRCGRSRRAGLQHDQTAAPQVFDIDTHAFAEQIHQIRHRPIAVEQHHDLTFTQAQRRALTQRGFAFVGLLIEHRERQVSCGL